MRTRTIAAFLAMGYGVELRWVSPEPLAAPRDPAPPVKRGPRKKAVEAPQLSLIEDGVDRETSRRS